MRGSRLAGNSNARPLVLLSVTAKHPCQQADREAGHYTDQVAAALISYHPGMEKHLAEFLTRVMSEVLLKKDHKYEFVFLLKTGN